MRLRARARSGLSLISGLLLMWCCSRTADAQSAPPAEPGTQAAQADDVDAQLMAAMLVEQELPDTSVPALRFYGFMDAGAQRTWGGLFESGLSQSDALSFVVGNINLYMDINPVPQWHGLVEVRFTTFPNGTESFDPTTGRFSENDTTVLDYTSPTGGFLSLQWGSIILERAHLDWNPLDALNVRVGSFLTPYGIWNVDHGTPTRIMLIPPIFVVYRLLPERQVGLAFFGTFHLSAWDLGYHLYVSNGRAVAVDYTNDKAVGGRVTLQLRKPFVLQLGASLFYGKAQNVSKSIGVTSSGMAGIIRDTTVEYEELAGGADVSLDIGALRIRSELVFNRTIYTEGKRALFGGVQRANATSYNAYVMFAYQLPWFGIEPLLYSEIIRIPVPMIAEGVAEYYAGVSVGINVYINPNVTLRTQAGRAQGFNLSGPKARNASVNLAAIRLIFAF